MRPVWTYRVAACLIKVAATFAYPLVDFTTIERPSGIEPQPTANTMSNITYIRFLPCQSMPNMTFAVPEELHREIRRHKEVRWSEIARRALVREVNRLHIYDRLLAKSELTEEDAIHFGRAIRRRKSSRRA